MNSVQAIGNLTRDPDVRFTKQGTAVTSFSIAVNSNWVSMQGERKESTTFINIVAWNKLAEFAGNNLTKGARVFVAGRLQSRSYETAEGAKRYVTEVVADVIAPVFIADQDTDMQTTKPKNDFSKLGTTISDDEVPF